MLKTDEQTYFSLNIKQNDILISKNNFEINKYIKVENINSKIIDLKFPFNLSQGTQILKNYRTELNNLELIININELNKKFTDFHILVENNFFILKGSIFDTSFLFKIALNINDNLEFVILEEYILESDIIKKHCIINEIFNKMQKKNKFIYYLNFLEYIMNIYPVNGYKIPIYKNLSIESFYVDNDNIIIKFKNLSKQKKIPLDVYEKYNSYVKNNHLINNIYKKNKKIDFKKNILDKSYDYLSVKMFIEFSNKKEFVEYADIILEKSLSNDIVFMLALKSKKLELKNIYYKAVKRLKNIKNENILEIIDKLKNFKNMDLTKNKTDEELFILFKKEKNYDKALYYLEKILNKEVENKIYFLEKAYFLYKKIKNEKKIKQYQEEILNYYKDNLLIKNTDNYIKNLTKALSYDINNIKLLEEFYKIDLSIHKDYKRIICIHYKTIRHLSRKEYIKVYKRIYMCAKINKDEKNIIRVLKKAKRQFLDDIYFKTLYKHWNI